MKIPEAPDWIQNFTPAVKAWEDGYEAGYKQACKDVKTEQLTMSEVFDERLAAGALELPPEFGGHSF